MARVMLGRAQQWLRSEGFGLGADGGLGSGISEKWLLRHDTDKPVLHNWGKKWKAVHLMSKIV